MSSLAQRGGRVNIRVGGNTQDYATLVASNSNGKMIQKQNTGNTNPVSLVLLLGAGGLLRVLTCNAMNERRKRRL